MAYVGNASEAFDSNDQLSTFKLRRAISMPNINVLRIKSSDFEKVKMRFLKRTPHFIDVERNLDSDPT